MSISERVKELIAEKGVVSTQVVQEGSEVLTNLDNETLDRCMNALRDFGVTENYREINETILNRKGKLSEDLHLEVGKNRIAVADATLSWSDQESGRHSQIRVSIKKMVDISYPFNLLIESSQGLQFSTSLDDPSSEQLSTDGDIGRWDIRNVGDSDNELGFYTTPNSLRMGIEERLAKVCAQLITKKDF